MRHLIGFILIALLAMGLLSCSTTKVASIQNAETKDFEVFTTKLPTKEYTELKYIKTDGSIFHGPEKLLTKLTKRAQQEGADAIINVKFDYQFWWPNVSGTAIKYKK